MRNVISQKAFVYNPLYLHTYIKSPLSFRLFPYIKQACMAWTWDDFLLQENFRRVLLFCSNFLPALKKKVANLLVVKWRTTWYFAKSFNHPLSSLAFWKQSSISWQLASLRLVLLNHKTYYFIKVFNICYSWHFPSRFGLNMYLNRPSAFSV